MRILQRHPKMCCLGIHFSINVQRIFKKMQEEQLPAVAQVSQLQLSWPLSMQSSSLKLMCVPHTDVDMCQGDRAPRYFFHFFFPIKFLPTQGVKLQNSSLFRVFFVVLFLMLP